MRSLGQSFLDVILNMLEISATLDIVPICKHEGVVGSKPIIDVDLTNRDSYSFLGRTSVGLAGLALDAHNKVVGAAVSCDLDITIDATVFTGFTLKNKTVFTAVLAKSDN